MYASPHSQRKCEKWQLLILSQFSPKLLLWARFDVTIFFEFSQHLYMTLPLQPHFTHENTEAKDSWIT